MKLILFCILQSAFGVVGTGLLNIALHGKPLGVTEIAVAAGTWQGATGLLLLFASFLTTAVIVNFASLAVYIPINTGLTFLFTILFAFVVQHETITIPTIIGMFLIATGIAVIASFK